MHRRKFLEHVSTTTAAVTLASLMPQPRSEAKNLANDKITIAMVGVKGRGNSVLNTFAGIPTVNVKYVCDIDELILQQRTEAVTSKIGKPPQAIKDFRRALDDKSVDALVLGTPDHWHALPTIMACQAGKDVYVEKPDGHNAIEGRTMVAAAKKYERIVQLGTQARSRQTSTECNRIHSHRRLGKALFAKAWKAHAKSRWDIRPTEWCPRPSITTCGSDPHKAALQPLAVPRQLALVL